MKKYEITITDKNYWDVPQDPEEDRTIDIQSEKQAMIVSYRFKYGWDQVYTEDRFKVVIEANNEDEAYSTAHEMLLDGKLDCFDSEYCLSKEGCNWWEDSQANPRSNYGVAYETFGDDVELDGGNMDYEIEEIE